MSRTENFRDKLMEVLVSIGENKYMQAIRNGMMMTIPFTIIGSIFTILSSFPIKGWTDFIGPYAELFGVMYSMTFGMMAIVAVVGVSYNMSQTVKIAIVPSVATALISFLLLQVTPPEFTLNTDNFGASGIFTAMLVGIIVPKVIAFFKNKNIVIKLPQSVPSYVSDSFTSLIPSFFILTVFWIIRILLNFDINHALTFILSPLIFGLNTLPGILVLSFLTLFLWICGINGDSIFSGIYYPIVLNYMAANSAAFIAGEPIPYITADGFYYFGMWMGGTGGTLGLVILMLRSKSSTYKALSKICLPTGIFCINEPLVFGFPIMFNPVMMIPYILTPLVLLSGTYGLMYFNIIGRPVVSIPWTTPPLINAFLCTGGDFRAVIWQIIEIIISVLIYLPFFKIAEKAKMAEEQAAVV